MAESKYKCDTCSEPSFKSRADWLFHLVLNRHSVKARENIQKLYIEAIQSGGSLYVISGFEGVDVSLLLDHVSGSLKTFSNFISFMPEANVCMIACDESEFAKYSATPQYLGGSGKPLKLRDYNEIPPVEWKSFFVKKEEAKATTATTPQETQKESGTSTSSSVNKRRRVDEATDEQIAPPRKFPGSENGSEGQGHTMPSGGGINNIKLEVGRTPTSVPNPFADDINIDAITEFRSYLPAVKSGWSSEKTSTPSTSEQKPCTEQSSSNAPSSTTATSVIWAKEMAVWNESVVLSEGEQNIRLISIGKLTLLLRPKFPKCELIPVGGDFLGFSVDKDVSSLFFDSQGITVPVPDNPAKHRTVDQSNPTILKLRDELCNTLKNASDKAITEVQSDGQDSVALVCLIHDLIRLKCKLVLRPLKLAISSLICKRLFFMNEEATSLMTMVAHWATKVDGGLVSSGLSNPYVLHWMVYFFLMRKKILPPAIMLQKWCGYAIMDGRMNVAFSYESSLRHAFIKPAQIPVTPDNVASKLNLFLEWFTFIDDNQKAKVKGEHFHHHFICLRYGELVEKRFITTLVREKFPVNPKKKRGRKLDSKQKKARRFWAEKLVEIGFDESQWELFPSLKLDDRLGIQHPFYIASNIAFEFDARLKSSFTKNIKATKENLAQLLSGSGGNSANVAIFQRP